MPHREKSSECVGPYGPQSQCQSVSDFFCHSNYPMGGRIYCGLRKQCTSAADALLQIRKHSAQGSISTDGLQGLSLCSKSSILQFTSNYFQVSTTVPLSRDELFSTWAIRDTLHSNNGTGRHRLRCPSLLLSLYKTKNIKQGQWGF